MNACDLRRKTTFSSSNPNATPGNLLEYLPFAVYIATHHINTQQLFCFLAWTDHQQMFFGNDMYSVRPLTCV